MMCPHCQGHYLKSMIQAETPEKLVKTCKALEQQGSTGCLISGGCNSSGRVPIPLEAVERVCRETNLAVNLHTGLVDEETAEKLHCINPYISFEVPTPYVLHHLYQLNILQDTYFASLSLLEGLRVVPHVMVGLQLSEEIVTIEKLRETGISSLVLIVFTPTRGTPFEKRTVDTGAVVHIFERARELFPRLVLGCMRPRIKVLEEKAALFDGVVVPSPWAQKKVEQLKIPVHIKETCCVME